MFRTHMHRMNDYEILGVATPVMDQIIFVEEDYINQVSGGKGGMHPVDYDKLRKIVENSGQEPTYLPGGSGSNTINGLAQLGHSCGLVGKIGKDEIADRILESLSRLPIKPLYVETDTPTAQVVCLVTPDGERTGRSFLGASREMRANDLSPDIFNNVSLVHIEGYALMNGDLVNRAMMLAKRAGAKISFDLGSFEIVRTYKDHIKELLPRYVDVVFANADETRALTDFEPEMGGDILSELCPISVVLMGKNGCLIHQGSERIHCPAFPVEAIDTTGAGDLFASGFLHGYLAGRPLEECGRLGCLLGGEVVQVIGAAIPREGWERIKQLL